MTKLKAKQLADPSKSIKFIPNKFEVFAGETRTEKVIEKLRGEACSLNEKVNCITEKVDQQEQYSR